MTTTTFTKRTVSPFRYDVVGSFLRPQVLKDARAQFAAGQLDAAGLKAVEDTSIIELIKQQEAAGLKAVTDGEFRRSWWHLDFFWGLQGISKKQLDQGYIFHDEETRAETATVSGKLSGANHPFVDHFKFVQAHVSDGIQVKQTIPAPAQCLAELQRPENQAALRQYYATDAEVVADLAAAYHQVIEDLYAAGARTIQLDDCTWGMLAGNHAKGAETGEVSDRNDAVLDENKQLYLDVNNAAIKDLPADLTITTHICRGNYHSTWASAGGYDSVADPLFNQENVKAYYLEYDSERAGGFEPLKLVSDDKLVVLGLITSKSGELEDRQTILNRIQEAAKYVPLDRLCLSTQCGFASTEEGNVLTFDQQWAKIALVKSIAEEVWGA
ncbi:5-methyltetrahydropteroyltriglutamate--homocysteine S-methyltransferase [Lactiplantibacillus mudanjiangensis]|uniref:5-methyltetrahydropteroyltriglutamate--homocystei ne methyltransferase [Lactobacillus sp.] n=1 Tax=Lactiplantibacillus mudanjiangensis TaxID=1296538 RepID=A0A660DW86_9LACO|nr:5-methyltetrahydropteroyltriglutamate--homocysteine S-methyltransferase [Lactiplantibacillus mudanjiangensis]VDG18875.1 5-methyltetrahydropteroyltriglutamate--homocysteine methyltransferase [Lactobacillus sp.] [Lactiplantibacillus mudanjiangensis]VDG25345.1 5-methyltetrahydropteroyltriglutamate--homocysteine methyltransferase [Lactobacillus sp.] [Lactiplantibacillus mudanjiangensis]VDG27626.1 5-methyltetrahydropteroyltriglutamate--homocysteine methyltransferase [Lactobacillus sp.] [Lactiplant